MTARGIHGATDPSTPRDLRDQMGVVFDLAPMMAWTTSVDGDCTFVNRALLAFTRTSFEEEIGSGWSERIHPDERARTDEIYQRAFEARQPFRMEYPVRRHDGQYRAVLSLGVPWHGEGGKFKGYLGFSVDVSELREAERSASAERQLYESFLGGLRDQIAVLGRNGTIVYVNEAWRDFAEECDLGLPENALGANYIGVCDAATGPEAAEGAEVAEGIRAVIDGRLPRFEHEYSCHEPGKRRWFLLRVVPLRDAGDVAALVQHVDVTPLRKAEEERLALETRLQHLQRLESLGVMAAGIAHDFNNLLTVIRGNSRMALDDLGTKDATARRRMERIHESAQQAARLTGQMLSYAGKGGVDLQPADLSSVVTDMQPLLGSVARGRGTLDLRLSDRLPAGSVDPTQIRQVILNLVTNAFEALEGAEGTVQVSTGTCEVDQAELSDAVGTEHAPAGEYLCLEIRDTGHGVEPEDRLRLFEPYFSTRFPGRGLGLAAVLGIVRVHGGVIQIAGAPGEGTTFRVLLPPASAKTVPVAARAPARPEAAEQPTVLVVDDEPWVLELATAFLERAGYAVIATEGGRKGVEALRARATEIDAVVLDLAMPDVSGDQALAEMLRIRPDLPVLLASGFNEEVAAERYEISGSRGFLQKPYEPEDLIARVREALGR